jgi:hypothetical protein
MDQDLGGKLIEVKFPRRGTELPMQPALEQLPSAGNVRRDSRFLVRGDLSQLALVYHVLDCQRLFRRRRND